MLEEAKKLLQSQEHAACFHLLRQHWLNKPDDIEAVRLLSALMDQVGKAELAQKLAKLCADPLPSDALTLFEAGYQAIEDRLPELAVLPLTRCLELSPGEPTVNYELGFALLSLKRYQEAIPYLEKALDHFDDFDTPVNLAVAYTSCRQPALVKKMLDKLSQRVTSAKEMAELAHQQAVLSRLELLQKRKQLSARDWMYIHYGSVLIKQNSQESSGGKFGPLMDDYAEIARTLLILRGILERLGATYDMIEYYSSLSRPLAHALAELLGLPFDLYGGANREERALLVMGWGSDLIGPHKSFIASEPVRSIFTYALTWQEPAPVTPELVGCLAEGCKLPWGERFIVEQWDDQRPDTFARLLEEPEGSVVSAEKILLCASDMESNPEVLNEIEELMVNYDRIKDHLILGNSKIFPRRPEYTNEIP